MSPLAFFELLAERLALGGQFLDPCGHLADVLAGGEGQFLAFGFADGGGFGGPQGLDLLVGVSAA